MGVKLLIPSIAIEYYNSSIDNNFGITALNDSLSNFFGSRDNRDSLIEYDIKKFYLTGDEKCTDLVYNGKITGFARKIFVLNFIKKRFPQAKIELLKEPPKQWRWWNPQTVQSKNKNIDIHLVYTAPPLIDSRARFLPIYPPSLQERDKLVLDLITNRSFLEMYHLFISQRKYLEQTVYEIYKNSK